MAGPKRSVPAPIDRPLSRSYLREFTGWSTAYPPGLSDPTSLRTMENVYITREGAARVRPGIRSIFTADWWLGNAGESIVGAFEHFVYDKTGTVALLFAVRTALNTVSFRVVLYNSVTDRFDDKPGAFPSMSFGAATTYVKYLQIDNKILALSDDPLESAVLFNVGEVKSAKRIPQAGLTIPLFTDALTVVHPDAGWINVTPKVTRPTAELPTPQTLIGAFPSLGTVTTGNALPWTLAGHGLAVNQSVILKGTTAPGGFTIGTTYYVKEVKDKDTFTLTAALSGALITPTSAGAGLSLDYGPLANGKAYDDPNQYSFGFFYTFETEFGESAPSGITTLKTQRGWSQWKFNVPNNADGNPTSALVVDPAQAMDQLIGMLPLGQYAIAKAAGAIRWNMYQFTWNNTSAVPSVATLIGSRKITLTGTEATESWLANTPAALADAYNVPVPNAENRVNYSGGPTSRQGIAAGDRLILVNDGINQAMIRWSSNVPGEYTNFSPSKSGGVKTLSSGNLLVPMNVQLWQNPQSVDALCVLCKGLDGYHAAYYMAPSQVAGQSQSTLIMGFEETTATPGTVSPYGVEVLNNALYHPLEAELMKSTAANYNISHKTMTLDIANKWQRLNDKEAIVSSQHDSRLYYIVHNPEGEVLEEDCMGNEVWVLDTAGTNPSWSRWLVQGISLKKLQIGSKLYMAIVRPDAIFIFDELAYTDEYAEGAGTRRRNIKWHLETNTLGANRAHDAWARVQRAQVHVGDWLGTFEWGIRGWDVHGQAVDVSKRSHTVQSNVGVDMANGKVSGGVDLGDATDDLLVRKDIMEWTFYAHSVEAPRPGETLPEAWEFFGQIDYVQFLMTQDSMNIGYESGSIETFEYQRNAYRGANNGDSITQNGLAMPLNTRRP